MKLTPKPWTWDRTGPADGWLDAHTIDLPVVWQAWLTVDSAELSFLASLLPAEERARLERFRLREDQQRFLIGRGLLRILAGTQLRIRPEHVELTHGPFGKPFLVSRAGISPLHFNVSHSGKLVLLAFNHVHEVGVDVEEVRPQPDWEAVAQRVFPAGEYNRLTNLNPEERLEAFFRSWTRHEAGLKTLGRGFSDDNNADLESRLVHYELALPEGYQGAAARAGKDATLSEGWDNGRL